MMDGWGGSTEPYDDTESDDCYTGWHGDTNLEEEEKYKQYQEDTNKPREKYYMPPYPIY